MRFHCTIRFGEYTTRLSIMVKVTLFKNFRTLFKKQSSRYLVMCDGNKIIVFLCNNFEISTGNNMHPSIKIKKISFLSLNFTIFIDVITSAFNRLNTCLNKLDDIILVILMTLVSGTFISSLDMSPSGTINQTSPCSCNTDARLLKGTTKAFEFEYVITQTFIFNLKLGQ